MQYTVVGNAFAQKTVHLPASKSISNRALIINALSGKGVTPENLSDCDDTFVMVRGLNELKVKHAAPCIQESDSPTNDELTIIDIMAAGTAMRFLTAFLSVTAGTRVITGTERMRHRPISVLVDALRTLGANIEYAEAEGFPPLRITGKSLEGGAISLPGNVSSQYVSALLMIGPRLEKGLTLTLTGEIVSRPYIDMTLSIMREFGAKAEWTQDNVITVWPTPYSPIPYFVENDWSASSYWYEMVALTPGSEVVLPGLFEKSLQGDQAVKDIFAQLGVSTTFLPENGGVCLKHTGKCVERLDIDMLRQPDLAQTVVVTCCMLGLPFHITGLQSLKIKETDRIHALRCELAKLGYEVGEADDSILYWEGKRIAPQADAAIDTYEDHRMAMSFAPCAQVLKEIRINNPQVVSKSYPSFWKEFETREN